MSEPISRAEIEEQFYALKIKCAEEAGLVFSENDEYGDPEFIGTDEKWSRYKELLEEKING